MPASDADKLHAISEKYHGNFDKNDITKLATQIARIASDDDSEAPTEKSPLLAMPFTAPAGDSEAGKLADSTFALVYGKLAIAHHGSVGLSKEADACSDLKSALDRGRSNHSKYVLCGAIGAEAGVKVLTVKMAKVDDGATLWSKAYPVVGADPTAIAVDVDSKVPSLTDE